MATGPSDDFHNQQTTKAAFGTDGAPSDESPDQSETPEPRHEGFEPPPWYRSPPLLIAWVLLVLILIALIVYGLGELISPDEGTGPAPSSTTTTTTAPVSTTTGTTSTTQPPVSTTTATTPPPTSSTVEQPPQQQPTQQQPTQQPTNQPTQKHHPHLPTLPPGIKLPF